MSWVAVGAAAVTAVGSAVSARSAGRASEKQNAAAIEAEARMAREQREHEEKIRLEDRKQKQDAVGAYKQHNSSVTADEPADGPDGRAKFFGASGVPGVAGAAVRGVGGPTAGGISNQMWGAGISALGSAVSGAAASRSAERQQASSIEAQERIEREKREYDDMVRAEVLNFKNQTMGRYKGYANGGEGGKPVTKPAPITAGLGGASDDIGRNSAGRGIDPDRGGGSGGARPIATQMLIPRRK